MNAASKFFSAAAITISLISSSGMAHADALPPNACEDVSQIGQSCDRAGSSENEPGTCVSSSCPHSTHYADGGFSPTTYDPCAICEGPDGGAADAGNGDGGATTTTTTSSSDSGCSASPSTRDGGAAFAMLAVGLIGLVLGRRKRA
ncbi:MAG: hypothetical protein ABI461_03740 [Polyangiaceae bacterium]